MHAKIISSIFYIYSGEAEEINSARFVHELKVAPNYLKIPFFIYGKEFVTWSIEHIFNTNKRPSQPSCYRKNLCISTDMACFFLIFRANV